MDSSLETAELKLIKRSITTTCTSVRNWFLLNAMLLIAGQLIDRGSAPNIESTQLDSIGARTLNIAISNNDVTDTGLYHDTYE